MATHPYTGHFDVRRVETLFRENQQRQKTHFYEWQNNDDCIVMRRCDYYTLRLTTTTLPAYDANSDVLILRFEFSDSIKATGAVINIRVATPEKPMIRQTNKWFAEIVKQVGTHLYVRVVPPPMAQICRWNLSVLYGEWSKRGIVENLTVCSASRDNLIDVYVVCNPFHPDDDAYAPPGQLAAYMTSTADGYLSGLQKSDGYQYSHNDWIHDQFNKVTLDRFNLMVAILVYNHENGGTGLPFADCGDLVRLTRKISYTINQYIIYGCWNECEIKNGAVHPSDWTGSLEILKLHERTKKPVKFAQCFTFACLFVTFLRSIGIYTRPVTCIGAAHDTDKNLTVDRERILSETGELLSDTGTNDSIWNFHVWVEAWFRRPDLNITGLYDGWQVLDATPQEESDGLNQCGPTSVRAIREGRLDLPFDANFVYSEVNADVFVWYKKLNAQTGETELLKTRFGLAEDTVGRAVLTIHPKTREVINLTNEYKPSEGTTEERKMHIQALKRSGAMERDKKLKLYYGANPETNIPEDVTLIVDDLDAIEYGSPVKIYLKLKNTANVQRTLNWSINVSIQMSSGRNVDCVFKENRSGIIKSKEQIEINIDVPFTAYAKALTHYNTMCVVFSGFVAETNQIVYNEDKFQVVGGPIIVKAPTVVSTTLTNAAEVVFTNFLNKDISNVEFYLDGGPLSHPKLIDRFPTNVKSQQRVHLPIKFRSIADGTRHLVATVKYEKDGSTFRVDHVVESYPSNANSISADV
uniref:TGc domain-containing protein n=1 Tax=Panagrellus redivivus TaxID=6233 RepID=A0A7E4VDS8_PANRE